MPQWLPQNIKMGTKLMLTPSNFSLRKVLATESDVTVFLKFVVFHVRKQQFMSSVALTVEKLRAS